MLNWSSHKWGAPENKMLRRILSAILMYAAYAFSRAFFRLEVQWLTEPILPKDWDQLRLIVFLNHTSLFEPIYIRVFPLSFIWELSGRLVAPGADKTLNRPIVGRFYKLFAPKMVTITRKRDSSWKSFLAAIQKDSIVAILPEGRMMRKGGYDSNGKPMSVRSGIVDVLRLLPEGHIVFAYSQGLHHVHAPGDPYPKVFKTLRIKLEATTIEDYCSRFSDRGSEEFKNQVIQDLEVRISEQCPPRPLA